MINHRRLNKRVLGSLKVAGPIKAEVAQDLNALNFLTRLLENAHPQVLKNLKKAYLDDNKLWDLALESNLGDAGWTKLRKSFEDFEKASIKFDKILLPAAQAKIKDLEKQGVKGVEGLKDLDFSSIVTAAKRPKALTNLSKELDSMKADYFQYALLLNMAKMLGKLKEFKALSAAHNTMVVTFKNFSNAVMAAKK